ncbi:MAG: dihydrofolate reductase [Bacteroidota bacterium]
MKSISIIVAIAENNAIGKNNDLLCHLPEDLKRFKQLTTGNVIVMGKKTYESLPKRPLPNRTNIVITDNPNDNFKDCTMAFSIEDAISKMSDEKENFIIGGGSIYKQFLQYADKLYLTKIIANFEADTFFPEINYHEWEILDEEKVSANENNSFDYTYLILKRKK